MPVVRAVLARDLVVDADVGEGPLLVGVEALLRADGDRDVDLPGEVAAGAPEGPRSAGFLPWAVWIIE
ncbi:hypothetical protein [Actinomycetospora callitridis]|uniref:hypothetical protein n=1 Tax=Actinomycetospora callitridis TaxID=913944 RepID=UPI0023658C83|nr:hypothetical protein [Actinomycetospora callitridis]MDD7921446.1 hypothetical protein [Actinomycetospora callitridis]